MIVKGKVKKMGEVRRGVWSHGGGGWLTKPSFGRGRAILDQNLDP